MVVPNRCCLVVLRPFQSLARERGALRTLLVVLALLVEIQFVQAQSQNPDRVLVTVNQWSITESSVHRYLENILGTNRVSPEAFNKLKATGVEQLVKRQIILSFLATTQNAADKQEIEMAVKELIAKLAKVGKTLESHLGDRKLTEAELRNEFAWKISWSRYLKKTLTEKNLESFYDRNRRRFDGTRLKVAHILFKIDSGDEASYKKKMESATKMAREIANGKTSWSEAVVEFSDATSSKTTEGLVGWIGFDKPMPDSFSKAAFELDPGQISPPTRTKIGIHLIKCLEVEPGKRGPRDVKAELEAAATRILFDKLADEHRPDASIQNHSAR